MAVLILRDGSQKPVTPKNGYAFSQQELSSFNDAGIVVGQSTYGQNGDYHAFVYAGKKMKDLNSLIPSNSGWELDAANGINNAGKIVGYGTHNGAYRAFLLTPR